LNSYFTGGREASLAATFPGEDNVPRPDTSSLRRQEIIAATISVLAREGLARTTTRKLASEAKMNQATLLYYFETKDELLFAVLQQMMQITLEIARTAVAADLGLNESIAGALRAYWRHVEATPELQVMQYELTLYALRNPESAWLARQQYSGYCQVVEELFQDAFSAAGQTSRTPLDSLARFVVGGLDGMILQFVSDQDSERAQKDLNQLIAAVLALAVGAPV
jgi:AcrR family transcriptional regulator